MQTLHDIFANPIGDEAAEYVRAMLVPKPADAWFASYMLSGLIGFDTDPELEDIEYVEDFADEPYEVDLPEADKLDDTAFALLESTNLAHEYAFADGPYDRFAVLANAVYIASKR